MSLRPGTRLGPYEVVAPLGAGGMGDVYRARDTKLGRDVALKFLRESFVSDPERMARFEREARLLASLNHPNIAILHGYEESDAVFFLVMELVPGETLAERIDRGPVALEEVIRIFRQIAEALEAAHEKGVVHRDLKPANVKVTPEGRVKVLDFGLAKAFRGDPSAPDLSHSPTLTMEGTNSGVILGTATYMSPEQARGRVVDKRTDIWSFGCVLYEALTCHKLFAEETLSDTMAAILGREPDWGALPATTPPGIRRLLRRCLQKDSNRRLHDIADARIELEDPQVAEPSERALAAGFHRKPWRALAWGMSGLAIGALAASLVFRNEKPQVKPRPVVRQVITVPSNEKVTRLDVPALALSPDGTQFVYVASRGGRDQLYLRSMDEFEARPIRGTEGARNPFFSHDSQWIGFFGEEKLKKVSVRGGAPLTLCNVELNSRGASWGESGIVFQPAASGPLYRVSEEGGIPQALTQLDEAAGEIRHLWPQVLPGARAVIFTVSGESAKWDDAQIVVQSLESGERRTLVEGGTFGRYVPTGHLVYALAGALLAVPFDLERLKVTGAPVPVVEGVLQSNTGTAQFTFSETGSLAFVPGDVSGTGRRLVWVNRRGELEPLAAPPRPYVQPRISPEGQRVAVHIDETRVDVWLYEVSRSTLARLTVGDNCCAAWSPDGRKVTFYNAAETGIFWKAADGSGPEQRLTEGSSADFSWSPDGNWLAFTKPGADKNRSADIWILPAGGGSPTPFLQTPFQEQAPVFSPDGRFLAYACDESGRFEVYARSFPGTEGKWLISTEGGTEPAWPARGSEIIYLNGDQVMAVKVRTEPELKAERPQLLFMRRSPVVAGQRRNYDVSPDGQKFLMIDGHDQQLSATQMKLVIEWFEDLKNLTEAQPTS